MLHPLIIARERQSGQVFRVSSYKQARTLRPAKIMACRIGVKPSGRSRTCRRRSSKRTRRAASCCRGCRETRAGSALVRLALCRERAY